MCVILSAPSKYSSCTLKDQNPHIAYNQQVITQKLPNMSQEIIGNLDFKDKKTSTLAMGDSVCYDITELKDITFGTTSRKGRCPECECLRLRW